MNSDVRSAPAKPWQRNSGGAASRPAFLTESGQSSQIRSENTGLNNDANSSGNGRGENTTSLIADDSRPPARPWEAGNSAGNYNPANPVSVWGNGNTYGLSNYNSGFGWQGINSGYMNNMSNRYGPNFYGMYRSGYGGMNSLSPYSSFGTYRPYGGGMYNNWGGPTGGFGFGGAPFDRGNPQGGNQGDLLNGALIHPWQALMHTLQGIMGLLGRFAFLIDENTQAVHFFVSALLQLFDRAGMLYGEGKKKGVNIVMYMPSRKRRSLSHSAAEANTPSVASGPSDPQSSISGPGKDGENRSSTWNNVWSSNEGEMGVHNGPQDS